MFIHLLMIATVLLGQAPQTPSNAPQQTQIDPSQMSVAERAAAARKARAAEAPRSDIPPLTPEQRGSVRGEQYVNDFFHFKIDLANQWEPLGIERIAASRAKMRELGLSSSHGIALEMEDGLGRNVILNILPLPPDAPANGAEELATATKKFIFQQETSAKDANEQVFLGDAGHKFAAFRYVATMQAMHLQLVQSKQLIFINGFGLMFTVTGRSEKDVTDTLTKLNSRLVWTAAR